ncbi:MAG: hypothetical protein CL928_06080 [Deltaproteobacteria bacterium]|nr:hypothetical protein [Deltaproteobacteria bacterium]
MSQPLPHAPRRTTGSFAALGLVLAMGGAALLLLSPSSVEAGVGDEVGEMPQSLPVDGTSLALNGHGVRTKLFLPLYAIGLYLEEPLADATSIVALDRPKAIRMELLLPLSGKIIGKGIARGFARSSSDALSRLSQRLDTLRALVPNVRRGDTILMEWSPDRGTIIHVGGQEQGVIPGKDFADALFSVWLGTPVGDDDLKESLLGGSR